MANVTLSDEDYAIIKRIDDNCKLLASGYSERVEYKASLVYHRAICSKGTDCDCPRVIEDRVRRINRPSLIAQLKEWQQNCDVDRNPKAARGAPRVKTPRMHPELRGFFTLDEITCEAYTLFDRILEEGGRDRSFASAPIEYVINGMAYQMTHIIESHPDLAQQLLKSTGKWVAQAKAALNQTVSDAMLGETVCGNCGGGLSVAWDNSSDVRCVGSPSEPPCGETYPMSEWVTLYERGKR